MNAPIQMWRSQFGDQNTTWPATVARNCLILDALLRSLKYPASTTEGALDHGLPRLSSGLASASAPLEACPITHSSATLSHTLQSASAADTPPSLQHPSIPSTTGRSRTCPRCSKRLANTSSFNQHLKNPPKSCSAYAGAQFTCDKCGRTQTTKWYYQRHVGGCSGTNNMRRRHLGSDG